MKLSPPPNYRDSSSSAEVDGHSPDPRGFPGVAGVPHWHCANISSMKPGISFRQELAFFFLIIFYLLLYLSLAFMMMLFFVTPLCAA